MSRLCQRNHCTSEATVPVRMPLVGDLVMCHICFQALVVLGMDIRRTDEVAFIPVWRRRQQRAKDYTGSVA